MSSQATEEQPLDPALVLWLRQGVQATSADIGGKAAGLLRLLEAGMPVPPAWCVTTSAYHAHFDASGAGRWATAGFAGLSGSETEHRLAEIRGALEAFPLAPDLRHALRQHFLAMNAQRVAVRSSATTEDLEGASAAGLHDTVLGVQGLDEIAVALKRCWASLWTPRAWAYRRRMGQSSADVAMAVVVQEHVAARAAGVVFTRDPRDASWDVLVLEAVHGLGEGLVGGRVPASRLIMQRQTLEVLQQEIADQTRELVAADGAPGVSWRDLDARCRGRLPLTVEQAQVLARQALDVEARLGSPVDLEWAMDEKDLFLLQARALTTGLILPQPPAPESGGPDAPRPRRGARTEVWSNLNAGEVLPDVVTPLTWSVLQQVDAVIRRILRKAGFDLGARPLIGRIAGRAYFNLNTLAGFARSLPAMKATDLSRALGGARLGPAEQQALELSRHGAGKPRGGTWARVAALPGMMTWLMRHQPQTGRRFVARLARDRLRLEAVDLAGCADADVVSHMERIVRLHFNERLLAYPGVGVGFFLLLELLCSRWLEDPGLANGLLIGSGQVCSADAGLALWRLARAAHDDPAVGDAVRQSTSFSALRPLLEVRPEGRRFLACWDEFLTEHGHHCRGEVELANPRWRERPDYVLELVRSYMSMLPAKDVVAEYQASGLRRRRLTKRCLGRLDGAWRRMVLTSVLRRARDGLAIRETIKSEAVRHLVLLRRMALFLGGRWQERRWLEQADDVFLFELGELWEIAACGPGAETLRTAAARREQLHLDRRMQPPAIVVGAFDGQAAVPAAPVAGTKMLKGLAVCSGQARGKARVIEHAGPDQRLEAGEILIAPFTDPGWTPYFLPAAGIVVDMGGLLSHGSIVAREYGIPAVVNVGPATRLIRTGQTVHVDGDRGVVHVLDD